MSATKGEAMSNQDDRPDEVDEADFVEQHRLADATEDDGSAVPALADVDEVEADPADVQEQHTPAPLDDEDDFR